MGRQDAAPLRKPIMISILVSCLLLGLTGLLAMTLAGQTRANESARALVAATAMRGASDQYVSRRELALRATVALFDSSDQVLEREFSRFATHVTSAVPALRSLNFVDRGLTVRWVVPVAGNEKIVNHSVRGLTGEKLARLCALTGRVAVSDPIHLIEGGKGFLMYLPVRERGTLTGYVEAVNQVDRYIEVLQVEPFSRYYGLSLTDSEGRTIYGAAEQGEPVVRQALPIGDRTWMLSVWPRLTWWEQLPVVMVWLVGFLVWGGSMGLMWGDWFSARRLGREVAARTSDLAASRDQLAVILDGVADAIVAWTPEQKLVYANPAAKRHFGLSEEATSDWASVRELFGPLIVGDETGAPIPDEELPTRRAMRGERIVGQLLRYRSPASGEERVIMVSSIPVGNDGDRPLVIAIYHDLTERIRLEGQLKAQLEELKQLDRLKNEFLSVVTHELRTPLTSIKGYSEFLEDEIGGPLTLQQREYLAQVQVSAGQLEMLVDDLLDLARMEAGRFSLRLAPVDATAIVHQVGEAFLPQAREAALELVVEAPGHPVAIEADPRRVVQVLNNLMSNALKFTRPGGRVCLALVESADHVDLEVSDTGIGVAPEHLVKLFSKFYQVEGALNRTYKGTGLGLPITKGLVEAHGGRISVESEPGRGTTFTVRLPRGRVAEPLDEPSEV